MACCKWATETELNIFLQGQYEETVTQYRRALQIKPDFILAHDNLASLLSQ
jgi:hypothetical protein